MKPVFVVHFNPIEKYPPVLNLIDYLSNHHLQHKKVHVFTTTANRREQRWQKENIVIHYTFFNSRVNRLSRFLVYFKFNLRVLFRLLAAKPDTVAYFETLSAWAPVVYKRLINRQARMLIHYHEYTPPHEYNTGMFLIRYFHQMEKSIYQSATWLSHTNLSRLNFFLKDEGLSKRDSFKVLPNYPPLNWQTISKAIPRSQGPVIRVVYVGALSMEATHIVEAANFIADHPKKFTLDIYSDNITSETRDFLAKLNASNIAMPGAVNYNDLPRILPKYNVGLILYRANTPNFEFNAPNKFFEYRVCGLNIVYASAMKGLHQYDDPHGNPWVRGADFGNLSESVFADSLRSGEPTASLYQSESELAGYCDHLINNPNKTV